VKVHLKRLFLALGLLAAVTALAAGAEPARPTGSMTAGGLEGLEVPVEVPGEERPDRVAVELLETDDRVIARTERSLPVQGATALVPLGFLGDLPPKEQERLAWLRLRVTETAGGRIVARWLAPAEMLPGAFELVVPFPDVLFFGHNIPIVASARHPVTGRPLAGVRMKVDLEGASLRLVTGPDGFARGELPSPAPTADGQLEAPLRVEAWRGPFRWHRASRMYFTRGQRCVVAVDRPLYRPGETVHVWAVLLDEHGSPRPRQKVRIEIRGEEDVALQRRAITGPHGVASVDVELPKSVPMGEMNVLVRSRRDGDFEGGVGFEVAPVELPRFLVQVEPEDPWVLVGQAAHVRVRVWTASGHPMAGVPVTVTAAVHEWAGGVEPAWRGVTGGDGTLVATLSSDQLGVDAKALGDWLQYQDVPVRAFAVDPATGRPATARTTVRVSGHPLHVHLDGDGAHLPGQSTVLPVTTSRPDGSPLAARITVRGVGGGPVVAVGATDASGVGTVKLAPSAGESNVLVEAVADDGATGRCLAYLSGAQVDAMVRPLRFLPDRGEPLRLRVRTAHPGRPLLLRVSSGDRNLEDQILPAPAEESLVTLPWRESFRGPVTVRVVPLTAAGDHGTVGTQEVTVWYPDRERLGLGLEAAPYRAAPGSRLKVRVAVRETDGERVAAVVALAGVDEALEAAASPFFPAFQQVPTFRRQVEREIGQAVESPLDPRDILARLGRGPRAEQMLAVLSRVGEVDYTALLAQPRQGTAARLYGERIQRELAPWPKGRAPVAHLENELPGPQRPTVRRVLQVLQGAGWDGATLEDPWGASYRFAVAVQKSRFVLTGTSAGPDGRFGTADDLERQVIRWRWLPHLGEALQTALTGILRRTRSRAATPAALETALAGAGFPPSRLRDPWGRRLGLRTSLRGVLVEATAVSAGPDGRFPGERRAGWDDVVVARAEVNALGPVVERLARALLFGEGEQVPFPRNETELQEVLRREGIDARTLRDGLGRPLRLEVGERVSYADEITVRSGGAGATVRDRGVTRRVPVLRCWSAGEDGVPGTGDDELLAVLDGGWLELGVGPLTARELATSGVVTVRALDEEGQPLPGVTVTLWPVARRGDGITSVTGLRGRVNLVAPVGSYEVKARLPGFILENPPRFVPVVAGQLTHVELAMASSGLDEKVYVTSQAPLIMTPAVEGGRRLAALFTPRFRRDFRATCLWVPALATGGNGTATVETVLPDALTTWRFQGVALTPDGRFASAETEVVTSLPVEADAELPRRLTDGDRLVVPTVIRNHGTKPASLRMTAYGSGALRRIGGGEGIVTVKPGGSAVRSVEVEAAATGEGTLRVTVAGTDVGDAVERKARVEAWGRKRTRRRSLLLVDRASTTLEVPQTAVEGSPHLQLILLPGARARLEAALDRLMDLPGACGEQQISRGLVALELLASGKDGKGGDRARGVVELTLAALRRLRGPGGGFAYFRGGPEDPVLTAYAVRFLAGAKEGGVGVGALLGEAVAWLGRHRQGGLWQRPIRGTAAPTPERDTLEVALSLAAAGNAGEILLTRTLNVLEPRVREVEDPWVLASWALAAGPGTGRARWAVQRLAATAQPEGSGAFWAPRHNLPLGGWGMAGRAETTALAVRALAQGGGFEDLVAAGVRFLERRGTGAGYWWTSRATVEALTTLGGVLVPGRPGGKVRVTIDGREAAVLDLPVDEEDAAPLRWRAEAPLASGRHMVELVREGGSSPVPADLTVRFLEPWPREGGRRESAGEGDLILTTSWPSLELVVGRTVEVRAHAERRGTRGFGMLLAEIGLPPGMRVDPASCRPAVCEVMPGAVRFYLWPVAGGTDVGFTAVPRIAGRLHALPSRLSALYNPGKVAVLPPAVFRIRAGP